MGKGDKRSKRGKIWSGSYGNSRPHKKKSTVQPEATKKRKPAAKKPTKPAAKAAAKK